jgi:hypothetical protein
MSKGSKRGGEADELNLVPVMNLVTILIPFILMAAQFINLAVIDSTLPAIGAPVPVEEQPEKPPLNLSVVITDLGFTVAGAAAVLNPEGPPVEGAPPAVPAEGEGEEKGPTIPCLEEGCPTPQSYDYKELVRLLGVVKDEYSDEENVILVPESRIPYEVLVLTMDSTREDPNTMVDGAPRLLFPFVVIAGGAE